ncbi:MAG: hypothetical protein IKB98_07735 [Clostridia bacterium]|nr:hypothetical protein [Clostridia bacterium]
MKNELYGDGIRSDFPAIQEMLDSGVSEVCLPRPKNFYLIDKTLKIHGGQTLKLSPTTVIKLADDSNCEMLTDCDFNSWKENVCVDGGIWDMNNKNQEPNPYWFPGKDGKTAFDRLGVSRGDFTLKAAKKANALLDFGYSSFCMRFCRIKNFTLKNVHFKDAVTYCFQGAYLEDFKVCDIFIEFNQGAPKFYNQDGIHFEGHCKRGLVQNIKGQTHDDMVALTADDSGPYGPIEDIVIDGVYSTKTHSAVRLLSHGEPVKNITIKNVFGDYYTYGIGLTKYHGEEWERGIIENVCIENFKGCHCKEKFDYGGKQRPLIWIQAGVDVKNLDVYNVSREEHVNTTPLLHLDEGASVENFNAENITQKSFVGEILEVLKLDGSVKNLSTKNITNE